jgi:hypothetical protein
MKLHINCTALEKLDAEALAWLKHAYDQNSAHIAQSNRIQ